MTLRIVTDSTCDLPAFLIEERKLEVVPSILILDGVEYADGEGISRQEFYDRLASFRVPPTTAAPSVGELTDRYESVLSSGADHILSIHASGALTAILSAAAQAARDFPGRVTVVDSLSISLGLGHQVLACAEASEDGLQAALQAASSVRSRLRVAAALDTLEYVRRSGRLPAAAAFLGGLLSARPLIEVKDGAIRLIGAVRTRSQADEHILRMVLECGEMESLGILHSGAEERARDFLAALMRTARQSVPREALIVNITPVIGAHAGPNGLGFAAVRLA
jgi:DegV family protein with EDD domain